MYYAVVNWYNEYDDEEDSVSHLMIPASNWNEAMQKITNQFRWINSIKMEELISEEAEVVYIPSGCIKAVINENTY